MSERRSSTTAVCWWPSRSAVRACRSGSWWKTTTAHIHGWRSGLTTASWPWPVGISARRRATLTVAVVVLSPIASIVAAGAGAATIFIITIITLVLIVLLWLVVLLRARSTRILSLWRRSWVCHRYCRRGCAASFCRSLCGPFKIRPSVGMNAIVGWLSAHAAGRRRFVEGRKG